MNNSHKIIFSICTLICALAFAGCQRDNDEVKTSETLLYSFGPTGASPGDTIRFVGVNLDKVTEISFTGVSVKRENFLTHTNDLITLLLPTAAEKGFVTITTSSGEIKSKTQFNASIKTTVASITPSARPGENITIKGQFLNWVDRITFNNGIVVESFVDRSSDKIIVKVPEAAQDGTLILHYGGTDSAYLETTDTLKVILPIGTVLSPNPVKYGEVLKITGTDLDLVKQIEFPGISTPLTSFESQSATEITVKVGASAQTGKIALVAASGVKTYLSNDINMVLPVASSMTPNPVAPGQELTITGTNLDLVTGITFTNAPKTNTFISQSATAIKVKVPTGVMRGRLIFDILNSTRTVQSDGLLEIAGDEPPPAINLPIFKDEISNMTKGSGWGGSADFNNTLPVREGNKSIKITYSPGWGSPVQLVSGNINISPFTVFKISIYGAPGSGGKKVRIVLNRTGGYNITVVEGKWSDYAIPLSSLISSGNTLTELWLQEYSGSSNHSIYVDAIGLF